MGSAFYPFTKGTQLYITLTITSNESVELQVTVSVSGNEVREQLHMVETVPRLSVIELERMRNEALQYNAVEAERHELAHVKNRFESFTIEATRDIERSKVAHLLSIVA